MPEPLYGSSPITSTKIRVVWQNAVTSSASMLVVSNWKVLMRPYISPRVSDPAQGVELTISSAELPAGSVPDPTTIVDLIVNEMTHSQPYRIFVSDVTGVTDSTIGSINDTPAYNNDAGWASCPGVNAAKPTIRVRGPYLTPGVVIYTKSAAENSWQASESFTYIGPRISDRAKELDSLDTSVNPWNGNEVRVILPNRAADTVVDIKAVLGSRESILVGQYTYS